MSGRTVLLAWELGGNLGHLARLLAIAEQLELAGDEIVWALPASALESPHLKHLKHRRVEVPNPVVTSDKVVPWSYAGILLNTGFANPAGVARAVQRWKELYVSVEPNLVVLDTAPMAQLAACLYGWPAVRLSNGFDSPPASCPTFGLRMRGPYIEHINKQHVACVNEAIGFAAKLLGNSDPPDVAGYVTYPTRIFDCIPETDPYGERKDVSYVGPLNGLPACEEPQWPLDVREHTFTVFAYLRGCAMTLPLLEALADANANVLCVTGGRELPLSQKARRCTKQFARAVQLEAAIGKAELVVSYAPLGVTTSARIHGKPQLLAPSDIEKHLLAARLEQTAAAQMVSNAQSIPRTLNRARVLRPLLPASSHKINRQNLLKILSTDCLHP